MLHLDSLAVAEGVDAAEPLLHAGKQHDVPAHLPQALPGEGQAPLFRLLDHGVHIGQNAVHTVGMAEAVGHGPEFPGRHAQTGDEGIILHVRGAEGLVKIVKKRHDGPLLVHAVPPAKKAAHVEPLFMVYSPPL